MPSLDSKVSYLANGKRVYIHETDSRIPYIVEKEPLRVAKIPITDDSLAGSILLHPRYVPEELEHEIIEVRGFRYGRGLYVVLDEPILYNGEYYDILNYKGTGADADRPMVIHPTLFYENSWRRRRHGQVFGALKELKGKQEYESTFPSNYVPYSPHFQFYPFPAEVQQHISKVEKRKTIHSYSQILRLCNTDIRCDLEGVISAETKERFLPNLITADAAMIRACFSLAESKKWPSFYGTFVGNRYINGEFTDAENYKIVGINKRIKIAKSHWLPIQLIISTLGYLPTNLRRHYLKELFEKIEIPLGRYRKEGNLTTLNGLNEFRKSCLEGLDWG